MNRAARHAPALPLPLALVRRDAYRVGLAADNGRISD
jgi:hypothetical protein